ncbi:MAG: quinone-dependent dihydroorotate dehydrogenase, partial [Phycisphaerae bacterium]
PVLFVNVGKNRDTPNEKASEDYGQAIQELCDFGDVFVVNISSPNTKTLRELLEPKNLSLFLSGLFATVKTKKPILLKLSPDISTAELSTVLEVALSNGISGFILTNTLLNQKDIFPNHEGGGVSGVPLKERSLALLRSARETLNRLGSDALLVSVGGVMS